MTDLIDRKDLPDALIQAVEDIDSMIFSGDAFDIDAELRASFREYLGRWNRGLDEKAKTYVTFGQEHTHSVNGKTFDKDCIAVINNAMTPGYGRDRAFSLFGEKFCFEYWESVPDMKYFPRGLIEVE